jgi:hypothetical protein
MRNNDNDDSLGTHRSLVAAAVVSREYSFRRVLSEYRTLFLRLLQKLFHIKIRNAFEGLGFAVVKLLHKEMYGRRSGKDLSLARLR